MPDIAAPLKVPLSSEEARAQASRCLFCYDAPCTRSCPAGIDVPRFIRQILHEDFNGAALTIMAPNPLGATCARVCPTEVLCEGACIDRALQGAPIPVGQLQLHAVEMGEIDLRPGEESGFSVAIVGAGPAGLACARDLRLAGHAVTIFDEADRPGGLGTRGIALYKLTPEQMQPEIDGILALGATLEPGREIDGERLASLREEHDAVFLAVGLGRTLSLGLRGEEMSTEAIGFLADLHDASTTVEVPDKVAVIGGGNTALDCAIAAARLGASEVTLIYRRDEASMPAYRHEVELARGAGVEFLWLSAPTAFIGKDGHLSGIELQKLDMKGAGRQASLRPIAGSEFVIECSMAISAMGQTAREGLIAEVESTATDAVTCATKLPGVYLGGDCRNGGAELVDAVADGVRAAAAITTYLEGSR